MQRKPILVTGSHRSGSSWVGRTLARSPGVYYVREPFNPNKPTSLGVCSVRFQKWFTYVCPENESAYLSALQQTVSLQYSTFTALVNCRSPGGLAQIVRERAELKKFRKARGVPLLKDPIAIFSSEWLAERLGMNVVVMIRHPAAFVSSIVARNKKENWRFDFKNIMEQPLLVEHMLKEFEPDILKFLNSDGDIVDESILLWSIIHAVIAQYRDNHPEWTFLRHEDVSRRPEEIFQNLYEQLGLEWTAEIRQFVQESTRGSNATTENTHAFNTVRDSSANLSAWKRILTQAEIDRIEAGTRRVAAQFYSDEDW